jgi:hypothetical protein
MKNKKYFFISICLSFLLMIRFDAKGQTTFQKWTGRNCYDVQPTIDGGYIVAAEVSYSVHLLKITSQADTLWARTFSVAGGIDLGYSVKQTTDSGFIVAGANNAFGSSDVYLIRTDSNGDTLWTKTYGGTGAEYAYSMLQTSDGGFTMAGSTTSFGAGGADVYLIHTDANGNIAWTRTFGGTGDDYGYSVRQTADNGYIIAGETYSFGAGGKDVYLIRTDINGDTLWTKTLGGSLDDNARTVIEKADSGYVLSGYTKSFGTGMSDAYLISTNANGNVLWSKTYGSADDDFSYSMNTTNDGGYILTGETFGFGSGGASDIYLIRTDINGDTIWTKILGRPALRMDYGNSVQQASDGGFIIAGQSVDPGAGVPPSFQGYLLKTDSGGSSGCYEGNPPSAQVSAATIVSSPPTQVAAGGIIKHPAPQIQMLCYIANICFSTGIPEEDKPLTEEVIYPNPAQNFCIYEASLSSGQNGCVMMYDLTGRLLASYSLNTGANKIEMDLNPYSNGIYIYSTLINGKDASHRKLVIAR